MLVTSYLIWIADHRPDTNNKMKYITLFANGYKRFVTECFDVQAQLENYKIPEIAQSLTYQHTDSDGEMYFSVNDIEIRIAKQWIQFRFPFIFRVLVDLNFTK